MLKQLLQPVIRNVAKHGARASSSDVVQFKPPTINDIVKPQGCWQEYYDKRQKVYNTMLIIGVTALLSTITFIKVSGIIFFNFNPPEVPEETK